MKQKRNWEKLIIDIIQTCALIGAVIAAIFFGKLQNDINKRLIDIEEYNFDKEKKEDFSRDVQDKKKLRKMTTQILDYYLLTPWTEEDIKNRTIEDKIKITKEIQIILEEGMDNMFLNKSKISRKDWLEAYNLTEGILSIEQMLQTEGLPDTERQYVHGAFSLISGKISSVHSELKLSYTRMLLDLQKELNPIE